MFSLLRKIFGASAPEPVKQHNHVYSTQDMEIIGSCASRLAEVVNESVKIAAESQNPGTKVSRLQVAKQKLQELKDMAAQYPFVRLTSLSEIELNIQRLTVEFDLHKYAQAADGNNRGEELEKQGLITDAVREYERLVDDCVDTPFCYRRLAIIYSKQKDSKNEIRVVHAALNNIPRSNVQHYKWFRDRLLKSEKKAKKR